MKTEGRTS